MGSLQYREMRALVCFCAVYLLLLVVHSPVVEASRRRSRENCPAPATSPTATPTVPANPCSSDYNCPRLCPEVSSNYGSCCVDYRCGSTSDCEVSVVGTIFGVLFCCCCYGGIGVAVYFCLRAGQPHPAMAQGNGSVIVLGQPGQPGNNGAGYGQTGYAQQAHGAHSQHPGVQPGFDPSYAYAVHATPTPAYTATDPGVSADGWQKVTAPDGRVYEFNPATNETRWPDVQPAVAQPVSDPNWHQAQDPQGNVYEYNTVTNETRWPNGPPLKQ